MQKTLVSLIAMMQVALMETANRRQTRSLVVNKDTIMNSESKRRCDSE
jgi:hypothetical protein